MRLVPLGRSQEELHRKQRIAIQAKLPNQDFFFTNFPKRHLIYLEIQSLCCSLKLDHTPYLLKKIFHKINHRLLFIQLLFQTGYEAFKERILNTKQWEVTNYNGHHLKSEKWNHHCKKKIFFPSSKDVQRTLRSPCFYEIPFSNKF